MEGEGIGSARERALKKKTGKQATREEEDPVIFYLIDLRRLLVVT